MIVWRSIAAILTAIGSALDALSSGGLTAPRPPGDEFARSEEYRP